MGCPLTCIGLTLVTHTQVADLLGIPKVCCRGRTWSHACTTQLMHPCLAQVPFISIGPLGSLVGTMVDTPAGISLNPQWPFFAEAPLVGSLVGKRTGPGLHTQLA